MLHLSRFMWRVFHVVDVETELCGITDSDIFINFYFKNDF